MITSKKFCDTFDVDFFNFYRNWFEMQELCEFSENLISEVDANLLFQKLCIVTFIPEEYLPEWEILYIGYKYTIKHPLKVQHEFQLSPVGIPIKMQVK